MRKDLNTVMLQTITKILSNKNLIINSLRFELLKIDTSRRLNRLVILRWSKFKQFYVSV